MLANQFACLVTNGQGNPNSAQLATITALSMLAGGGVAGLLGQDANAAALAAQNETLNNTCAAGHNCGTLKSALADTGRAAWNTAVGTVEAVPNFLSGALPGYPDYVPFANGVRLGYDDPDFGQTLEFLGALGLAKVAGAGSEGTNSASQSITAENFFNGTRYTPKVLNQAASGDYHGFPQSVDAFSGNGVVTQLVGGDGVTRSMLTVPGSYNGKSGVFEYIRNPDGTINHRLFVPNK